MGSASQQKLGLSRGVDTTRVDPVNLFIVGLDGVGATEADRIDWLKGLFPKASERIDALRDARACSEVPESFVGLCRSGIRNPVSVENMNATFPEGADGWDGKPFLAVVAGRQRTKSLRIVNSERTVQGKPALEILLIQRKYGSPLDAREDKAIENVRVESSPSQRAWLANDLHAAGMSLADVAPRVGVSTEQAVKNLLALLECSEAVRAAVDAGQITQTTAQGLAKESDHAKQDAKLDALLKAAEGKQGREKSKALRGDESKPKPVAAKKLAKVDAALRTLDRGEMNDPHRVDEWLAILRWAQGDASGYDALPDEFRGAVLAAEKRGGKAAQPSEEPEVTAHDVCLAGTPIDPAVAEQDEGDEQSEAA